MSREEVLAEIAKLQQEFPALAQATAPTIDMVRSTRSIDAEAFVADPEQEEILAELQE
jgi:hypothetical protein